MKQRMGVAQVAALAREVRDDPDSFEVLRRKGSRLIVRHALENGESVIVKTWARSGARSRLSSALRLLAVDHEWRGLVVAERLGVRVPRPIGFAHVRWDRSTYGGALVLEDLGRCGMAIGAVKEALAAGREGEVDRLEEEILEMTRLMIGGRLLDEDHGFQNSVVTSTGELVRIDLERARKVRSRRLRYPLFARMLGRVLTTHVFAVQPRAERITRFALRLKEQVEPPGFVWRRARAYVGHQLRIQEQEKGYRSGAVIPP